MLEYYQLVLVKAGANSKLFRKELKNALMNLKDPSDCARLKTWLKSTALQLKDA